MSEQAPEIQVPCEPGNVSVQEQLELIPSVNEPWQTYVVVNGTKQNINGQDYPILFTNNPAHADLQPTQHAELVVTISDNDWEFFGNGVEYIKNYSNCNYNVDSSISADKKQLTLKVHQVDTTFCYGKADDSPLDQVIEVAPSSTAEPLSIGFRFTAKNTANGKYYMSQDPRVIVRRPDED